MAPHGMGGFWNYISPWLENGGACDAQKMGVRIMETIAAIYLGSCVGEVVLVMIVAGIIIFQWRGR